MGSLRDGEEFGTLKTPFRSKKSNMHEERICEESAGSLKFSAGMKRVEEEEERKYT